MTSENVLVCYWCETPGNPVRAMTPTRLTVADDPFGAAQAINFKLLHRDCSPVSWRTDP